MIIEFETKALEELYTTGSTSDSNYKRLSKDVVKRYVKVVNYLKAARRIEDLFLIKSLHYEKKKGDLNFEWCGCGLDKCSIPFAFPLFSR